MTKLRVEKAQLDSELREEQAKSEMLLQDLRKSNQVSDTQQLFVGSLGQTSVDFI